MSKETDAIKSRAKLWGSISIAYFVCALYLGLTILLCGLVPEIPTDLTAEIVS